MPGDLVSGDLGDREGLLPVPSRSLLLDATLV
jgi:hypothetical protein